MSTAAVVALRSPARSSACRSYLRASERRSRTPSVPLCSPFDPLSYAGNRWPHQAGDNETAAAPAVEDSLGKPAAGQNRAPDNAAVPRPITVIALARHLDDGFVDQFKEAAGSCAVNGADQGRRYTSNLRR